MNYRNVRYGNSLSVLGYGCMRFSRKGAKTDLEKAEREILKAVENGVNYFDTAYVYPGSEAALGEILARNHLRDKVYIATKLPHYLLKSAKKAEEMFQEQLRRLQTDHVDYYLMHMLTDVDTWDRLKSLGILTWLEQKKAEGSIGQIGFSYHGNTQMFCRLADAYDWDFCQIQYNYMDEHSQAGRRGLHYAAEKGMAVMIMEPLRGGKLVNKLPEKAKSLFASAVPQRTPAQWALGWLWDQKEVTVVLSGMNSEAMVEENVAAASTITPGSYTENDQKMLREAAQAINAKMKVGCTACGYCVPCPKGVDIPGCFAAYNRRFAEGKFHALVDYAICTALRSNSTSAANCIGCGKCESHCPQGLPIRKHLGEVKSELEGPLYRAVCAVAKRFVKF